MTSNVRVCRRLHIDWPRGRTGTAHGELFLGPHRVIPPDAHCPQEGTAHSRRCYKYLIQLSVCRRYRSQVTTRVAPRSRWPPGKGRLRRSLIQIILSQRTAHQGRHRRSRHAIIGGLHWCLTRCFIVLLGPSSPLTRVPVLIDAHRRAPTPPPPASIVAQRWSSTEPALLRGDTSEAR